MSSYYATWGVCPHVRGVVVMSVNIMVQVSTSDVIHSWVCRVLIRVIGVKSTTNS